MICVSLCFVLKLTACAVQQKLIGERLGDNQWVRQTVGVHKPFIRVRPASAGGGGGLRARRGQEQKQARTC